VQAVRRRLVGSEQPEVAGVEADHLAQERAKGACRTAEGAGRRIDAHGEVAQCGQAQVDEQRAADKKDKEKKRRDDSSDTRFRSLSGDDTGPNLQELMAREKNRVEESAKFSNFTSEDVPERSLPGGLDIEVWTSKLKTPTKSGTAYLYFFPQGFTERAQIYVKQGKSTWTLAVSPLTGKTVIHAEALELPRS
jgi:general secretion pathway protein H